MIEFQAMGLASRQVLGTHEDHAVVLERWTPQQGGPLMYLIDANGPPQWVIRIIREPLTTGETEP